nr:MAG TPA: hypothetical protein [Caudoviricetes sp.]
MRQVTAGFICHVVCWIISIARRRLKVTTYSHGVPMYAVYMGWHFLNG